MNTCTGLDEPDIARLRGIAISEAVERDLLESWAAARADRAALFNAAQASEPVAIIGRDFMLLWAGSEPLATLLSRHPGVGVGSLLYAASAPGSAP